MEADFCHDTPKHLHPCPLTGAYPCFPISLPDTSPQCMWHTRHDTPCFRPSGSRLGCSVESGDPSLLGVWLLRQSSSMLSAYRGSGSFWLCNVLFCRVNFLFFLCLTLLSLDPSPQPSPRGLPLRDTFYTTLGLN